MDDLSPLAAYLPHFQNVHVLCVGDVMLDRYIYGRADRMSPEAPIPVLSVNRKEAMLGAAGNVARNVVALGATAGLIGTIGDDDSGHDIARLITSESRLDPILITVPGRQTTMKTRYVAGQQQLLRADQEDISPLSPDVEDQIIRAFDNALEETDLVILSDYAKGVLSERVLRTLIDQCQAAGKPVVADPKSTNFGRYAGVTVIKPNSLEIARATGHPCHDDETAQRSAEIVLEKHNIDTVLVTRSEQGMTLVDRKAGASRIQHFRVQAQEVFDVSGAGDTSLAALGVTLGAGSSLEHAAAMANLAAGLVVAKIGTAAIYPEELSNAINAHALQDAGSKVKLEAAGYDQIEKWRARGLKIGFTNGCFDLFHPGHVSLVEEAKQNCDRLVVGLNTDRSVKALKGSDRPINPEMARTIVLASQAAVDMVILFDEDTPINLIEKIRPDVLIKGADYTVETVVGAEFVQSYGGRVHLAAIKPGHSTTNTITRMTESEGTS